MKQVPASVVISTPKDALNDFAGLASSSAAASKQQQGRSFAGGLVRALSRSLVGGSAHEGALADSFQAQSPKSAQTDEERGEERRGEKRREEDS